MADDARELPLQPESELEPEAEILSEFPEDAPAVAQDAPGAATQIVLPYLTVGIGASAGGLEAYSDLLMSLPAEPGSAFVLVPHLPADRESLMPEILGRHTKMPVREVVSGERPEPNHVYVLPSGQYIEMRDGRLLLSPRPATDRIPYPINRFFHSLAADQKNHAVGVILSGLDSDGAQGLKSIKGEGGITIVQNPKSARFPEMPRSGIAADHVDLILTPAQIGEELTRLGQLLAEPDSRPIEEGEIGTEDRSHFARLLTMLRTVSGLDFRLYKPTTLRRRLTRRMMLKRIDSLSEYLRYVQSRPEELRDLQDDFLINVTGFFRDPEVFESLKRDILPMLFENRPPDQQVRIWVAGCATGEEVYSIAICLLEFLAGQAVEPPIQIFGTDASERSIEKARQGIYPESLVSEISPGRLRRFFTKTDQGFQVSKRIRDLCIFARQNLCSDPPFSRLDLVSCRNVLIYLGPQIQKSIVSTFYYGLKPTGYLLLGASESLRDHSTLFNPVDRRTKYYSKIPSSTTPSMGLIPKIPFSQPLLPPPNGLPIEQWTDLELQRAADRIVLARYAPAGVIINDRMEVLQVRGHTAPFLEMPVGAPTLQLSRMARRGLNAVLKSAVQRAIHEEVPVQIPGLNLHGKETGQQITLEVLPIQGVPARPRCYLVLFVTGGILVDGYGEAPAAKPPEAGEETALEVTRLRQDLASTRLYLQSLVEERDARNQELTSAYEEVQSANEELQSTNEELETAKEELQSTNEELHTVNEELRNRNSALTQASNDLSNLFNSVNIPVLMLGNDLTIRHFTPPTERLMHLRHADIGRPIREIRMNLHIEDIEPILQDVLDTLGTREFEVQDREGQWHLLRIRPYRTSENKIDGLVLVLLDVNQMRKSEQALREALDFARRVLEGVQAPLVVLQKDLRIRTANAAFRTLAGLSSEDLDGRAFPELASLLWDFTRMRELLEGISGEERPGAEFELEHETPGDDPQVLRFSARTVSEEGEAVILLMVNNMTEQKRAEDILERDRERLAGQIEMTVQRLTRTQMELRALTRSLFEKQEEERRRVARELHDDLGQKLAVLAIEAERLCLEPPVETPDLLRRLEGLREQTARLSDDVRQISHRLHPAILDDLGLVPALRALVEDFGTREEMPVTFTPQNIPRELPAAYAGTFYRIAQEALRNVAKHAGKTHVRVRLSGSETEVALLIRDFGEGFDTSDDAMRGLGLISMAERAQLIGAQLSVRSQLGEGTTVSVIAPWPPESTDSGAAVQ